MTRSILAGALAGVWLAFLPASALAEPDSPRCREIDSDFTSELAPEGCVSPLGLCAAGTIRHDPLIKGPMHVTIDAAAASAGLSEEPPTLLSVSGTRTLSPHRGGTVSAHVVGVLDTLTFEFTELNVITGGTGPLAGATGTLYVNGRATGPTTFAGRLGGTVCLP